MFAVALAGCGDNNSYQPPPPAEVTVQKPTARNVTLYAELTGSTQASRKVDLVARVAGFLDKVEYNDGDKVAKDQTLFVIERAPYQNSLAIAEAAQAQQQAQLTQAESDLARQSTLNQRQVAAEATLESTRTRRDAAAAALAQAKGQAEQARINLSYTEVKAPFDGIVSARLVDPGALVGGSGPTKLATITQIDPIYVTFSFNEQQVVRIRRAIRDQGLTFKELGPIPVEVGLQTEDGYPHRAQIDYVAPEVDPTTGTLAVRAVVENANTLMLPGLFVRVRVPVQRDVPALLVPEAALGNDQQGRYLLVVNARNVVEQRPVETGDAIGGGLRIVRSGLLPEERVIVSGTQRAVPGNTVRPIESVAIATP